MQLLAVVQTSARVAATRARSAKTHELAAIFADFIAAEIPVGVAWLAGELPQGRLGIGYRTLAAAKVTPAEQPTLSIGDVDHALSTIAAMSGAGSQAARRTALEGLFAEATAEEQEFLIRLLSGEIRHGALAGVVTDAIARASSVPQAVVRRAAMLHGDLPQVAYRALVDGGDALVRIGLTVGRAVQPMLASPGESVEAAVDELGPDIVGEYKLDGARIQVHRSDNDVLVVTRTLRDITSSVPEIVELVRQLPCNAVILDGESLALTDSGRPRPFQETMSRFGSAESGVALHAYFFDCLHLDGVDLIDEPLSARIAALESVVGAHRIPAVLRPSADQVQQHFINAIAAGHEGVMVKDLNSTYAAGRRGKSWLKIKPEHTLDLIVLAAEWGYGRRTGWLSNLHLGARDPQGGEPVMVGKTFKGLTDELLRWQTEEFVHHESHRDSHTVYMRPEIVVEIELDGVQVSNRYPGAVALRFARVVRYRPDKNAGDADSIDAVRRLLPSQSRD